MVHQVIVLSHDQPRGFGTSRKRTEVALDMESAETEREASWTQGGLAQKNDVHLDWHMVISYASFIGMEIRHSNTPTTACCEWSAKTV